MADRVIIGVDPHKLSVTFEARDSREILRATGRFGTDARGYRLLLRVRAAVAGAGLGGGGRERDRAAAGAAAAGRAGNGCWMCRPSWPPGPGCSTPGRAARPTPPTRTPSSWSRCGTRACASWPPTRS